MRRAAPIALATFSLLTPAGAPVDEPTLDRFLTADPRHSAAACGSVDYATTDPGGQARERPPNTEGPTITELFLFVIAIDQIEPATNSFRFEGYGGLIWCDPRRAFDAEEYGSSYRLFSRDQARKALSELWWPGVVLATQLGAPQQSSELLAIFADGTVRFSMKFNARMLARFDFRKFPLDRQVLEIPVQTFGWNKDEVLIPETENRIGFDRRFSVPEWNVLDVRSRHESEDGVTRFVTEIAIGREIGFYLWKILLPLAIVACVAWSTFWMTRDVLAQRQRQSATAILSVVAYQFVATASLPRVSYLTLMDLVFLWVYLCVGATLVTNVIAKRRFRLDEKRGLRTDRVGRVAFPFVCAGGALLILLLSGTFRS